jgi:hypothetical protein
MHDARTEKPRRFRATEADGEKRFTQTLRHIEERAAAGPVTIGELVELCGRQGHAFVAIFLVLPFLQPIPIPGVSNVIGVLLVIIGFFVALKRPPWVPRVLARMPVQPDTVLRICTNLERLMTRLEKVVRPRATWLFQARWFRVANGAVWIFHAALFSLPLPIPLTNFFPATVILLLAIGILEEDARLIVVAYVGGVANVMFFGALVLLPALGWKAFST